ncbi:hypothetical protein UP06_20045 [Bradyrhizobium sp. LTSP857]|nr:hypothetical protein UP06_20045 [Bradyrhizobium sp. LTSP857]
MLVAVLDDPDGLGDELAVSVSGLAPIKMRPDVGAAPAAGGADRALLDVRQPDLIRPAVRAQGNMVAAAAVDQDAPNTHFAHLAEGDLHRAPVW